jgi:integrase
MATQLRVRNHAWLQLKDKNSGRGHSFRRTVIKLSLHRLRHNITSWLKRAGVPESVVRDIIGHESELVSREYTHMDDETKRNAILKLPVLNGDSSTRACERVSTWWPPPGGSAPQDR